MLTEKEFLAKFEEFKDSLNAVERMKLKKDSMYEVQLGYLFTVAIQTVGLWPKNNKGE